MADTEVVGAGVPPGAGTLVDATAAVGAAVGGAVGASVGDSVCARAVAGRSMARRLEIRRAKTLVCCGALAAASVCVAEIDETAPDDTSTCTTMAPLASGVALAICQEVVPEVRAATCTSAVV